MDISKLPDTAAIFENIEQRNKDLLKRNHQIFAIVKKQNKQIDRLFLGYKALGIIHTDTNEPEIHKPIALQDYIVQIDALNKELENASAQENILNNKFEYQKILEDYIVKMFGLVADRCVTLGLKMNELRKDRMESRDDAIALSSEYTALADPKAHNWMQRVELLFLKQTTLLEIQDKILTMEEGLMSEYEVNINKRNELIEQADKIFLA